MPVTVLESDSNLRVPIRVPRSGRVSIHVESDDVVDTYVVDDDGLSEFRDGDEFTYFGGRENRRNHNYTMKLDRNRDWYLLIVNYGEDDVAIFYEVLVA